MTGPDGSSEQRNCLLRELLADIEPLGGSQCSVAGVKLLFLFAVDRGPLGLVAGLQ
jgi:hypothetical protein